MQRIVIATSLWLAACAHAAPAPKAPSRLASSAAAAPDRATAAARRNLDDDQDVTCTVEVPTGSRFSRPVCRSQLEIDQNKHLADEMLLHPAELESHL